MVMSVLGKKMWRTIWHQKAQFFAMMALVMLGVATYVSMATAYYNLDRTKDVYYRRTMFADYFFDIVRAPGEVVARIALVPGVAMAAGRIEEDVPVLKGNTRSGTLRVITYPAGAADDVNLLELRSGRLFDQHPGGRTEVLLDPRYARANDIRVGDSISVIAGGRKVSLTVVGTAISPDFVYAIQNAASLAPDPKTFGIVMMPLFQAQRILNLSGQVNQVVIMLAPGADTRAVARRVEDILRPYGNLTSYARKDQLSNFLLDNELSMLRMMSQTLPVIFLVMAVSIQFVLLGRMIKGQRVQIGTMKALGVSLRRIVVHYAGYALVVSLAGGVLGSLLGIYLASLLSQMYAQLFNLPGVIGGVNAAALFYGVLLAAVAGLLAGIIAARGVAGINPAESMRPEPPASGGRVFWEGWSRLWRTLSPAWRMTLRTTARNRLRFAATLFGVVAAVGLMVMSLAGNDSINYLVDKYFFTEQRYDYFVGLTTPVPADELLNISRLDGVVRAEPILQIPVKVAFGGRTRDEVLVGLAPGGTMKRPVDDTGRPLSLPDDGVVLDRLTAQKLGVVPGDRVELKTVLALGSPHRAVVRVTGIADENIGGEEYMSLSEANRILGEDNLISGVMLKVDPGKAAVVHLALSKMGDVASVTHKEAQVANFRSLMVYYVDFDDILAVFGAALGFFIVFNASLMGFAERRRELASMRVIGFSRQEIGRLLWKENILVSFAGIVLGLPFGYLLAYGYIESLNSDLYSIPVAVFPQTYLISVLGGLAFVVAAHLVATRRLGGLNMIDVLKDQD